MMETVAWIWLRHLTLPFARIGVHAHEHHKVQTLTLQVGLATNIAAAARSDNVDDTLDWSALEAHVVAHVRRRHYNLVETLTYSLAESFLERFLQITCVDLEVEKVGCLQYGSGCIRLKLFRKTATLHGLGKDLRTQ